MMKNKPLMETLRTWGAQSMIPIMMFVVLLNALFGDERVAGWIEYLLGMTE